MYTGVSACFVFGTRAEAYCSKGDTCSLDSDGLLTNEDRPKTNRTTMSDVRF